MNSIEATQFEVLDQTLALRYEMLDVLTDEDLLFGLPGCCTLGELCREAGQYEKVYIESFRTFAVDWVLAPAPPGVERCVSDLRTWYTELDAEFKAVLRDLSEETIEQRKVNRAGEFDAPLFVHFHIYREAILIFAGKADIYLRALGKPRPRQWSQWIG